MTTFGTARLAYLIGVPLTWAALLCFHPAPHPQHIVASLQDDTTRWLVVHVGSVMFIGLMGGALLLLVRDLPGRAARVTRVAAGAFVLFYGAGESVIGIATGVLIRHAASVPEADRAASAATVQVLWDHPLTDDLLPGLGALAWGVATISAAIALHAAGAPRPAVVLVALSTITLQHGWPVGPAGLICFALAAGVLATSARRTRTPAAPVPVGR